MTITRFTDSKVNMSVFDFKHSEMPQKKFFSGNWKCNLQRKMIHQISSQFSFKNLTENASDTNQATFDPSQISCNIRLQKYFFYDWLITDCLTFHLSGKI